MFKEYRFLNRQESLLLAKMWFKLLRWDDTGLTWSFWAVGDRQFKDLCEDARLTDILPVKHPPDQSLETMEIFLRGLVIGFSRGNVDKDLEQWLNTKEGKDHKIPSVELQYQTFDSETKIDAMLINSSSILRAWTSSWPSRGSGLRCVTSFDPYSTE